MSPDQLRANEIAKESGSSNWLTCLPLEDSGYVDISARGVWTTGLGAFFDARVFNPFA